ncbi:MAG: MFS transporter [Chloroflexi bacterium]|nr:MAG: MFS transporter [Chloroflexota bacterium]
MSIQAKTGLTGQTLSEEEFQTGQVLTIVSGHFVHDTFSAFVSPLLPLIIEKLSLSFAGAGGLWAFFQIPALLNPFIGYLADRVSLRYFVILAPAVTATLMSVMGLAPGYFVLALLLTVTGVSVAAFHAPAPAMVARISGPRLGKGMSMFMAGGELGRTVGPLLAVWAVSLWSLEGMYRLMVLGWAASAVLYWRLREIPARPTRRQNWGAVLVSARRLFMPILGIIVPRELMLTALSVYLPTLMRLEGASLWVAGASLSIWELAGIGGALTSGTLSDRLGRRRVLLVTTLSSSLLMLWFLNATGWMLVPILLALGFTALSVTPVILAVVQEQMPENRAMANGLFLSMAFMIRSAAAFVVGWLGDMMGLRQAFLWAAIVSLGSVPMVYFLPRLKTSPQDGGEAGSL